MQSELSTIRPALTQLSDEELMFRDAVAAFAEDEVRPRLKQMENAAKLDKALIDACFELGLMGIEVPEALGGAGGTLFMVALAVGRSARSMHRRRFSSTYRTRW
jgi:butyryl-CoA dehydrogenase